MDERIVKEGEFSNCFPCRDGNGGLSRTERNSPRSYVEEVHAVGVLSRSLREFCPGHFARNQCARFVSQHHLLNLFVRIDLQMLLLTFLSDLVRTNDFLIVTCPTHHPEDGASCDGETRLRI